MPARALRSPLAARLAAAVVAAVALVGITALPAAAHHPLLSARAECSGWVTYTSTAWASDKPAGRANADVRIEMQVGSGWRQVGNGAYTAGNGYSFGGSFTLPSNAFPVNLRARAVAAWGDKAAGGQTTGTTVGAPSGCTSTPPTVVNPKASISHTCGGWSVLLDNRGSTTSVAYTVTVNGAPSTRTVAKGSTDTMTGTTRPSTAYSVSVSAAGHSIAADSFTTNACAPKGKPTASISVDCSGYDITVANTGGGTGTATFTVTVNNRPTTVTADSTPRHLTGQVTPGSNTFSVVADRATLATRSFDGGTCTATSPPRAAPTARISVDCHGFVTTLDNSASTTSTTYVVTTDAGTANATAHSFTVDAGSSTTPPAWPVAGGHQQTVTVAAPQMSTVARSFAAACAQVSPPKAPTSQGPTPHATHAPSSSPQVAHPTHAATAAAVAAGATSSPASPAAQVSPPKRLPRTGNGVRQGMVWGGLLLVVAGSGVLLLARNRLRRT